MHRTVLFVLVITLGTFALAEDVVKADSPFVRWQGRTRTIGDGSVHFDWVGVSAAVSVRASTIVIAKFDNTATKAGRFGVFVTDQNATYPVGEIFVTAQQTDYVLVADLDPKTAHTISLYNLMQPPYINSRPGQDLGIASFATDGEFVGPPPASVTSAPAGKMRRLEFLGDSITAATNIVAHPPCFDADGLQSQYSLSYEAYLCANFSAECSTVAIGGKGMYANCCDDDETMPQYYRQTEYGNPAELWNFESAPVPDAVIINLGTNDYYKHNGTDFTTAFTRTYVEFMHNVTLWYNSKEIVFFCGVGPITDKYLEGVQNAVAAARAEGIQAHYVNMMGPVIDGCAGHPGVRGHYEMFAMAQPVIAQVMGW